jgi:hypothetical protein
LELFSLEKEKVTLLPGGLFVCGPAIFGSELRFWSEERGQIYAELPAANCVSSFERYFLNVCCSSIRAEEKPCSAMDAALPYNPDKHSAVGVVSRLSDR